MPDFDARSFANTLRDMANTSKLLAEISDSLRRDAAEGRLWLQPPHFAARRADEWCWPVLMKIHAPGTHLTRSPCGVEIHAQPTRRTQPTLRRSRHGGHSRHCGAADTADTADTADRGRDEQALAEILDVLDFDVQSFANMLRAMTKTSKPLPEILDVLDFDAQSSPNTIRPIPISSGT